MSPKATQPFRSDHRSAGFLLAYALANAGGVIGFLPLLTLLLPMKVQGLAGDARIGLFTATVIAGAIAASISNILFGWLSDRSIARGGGRRRFVAGGLAATALSYAGIAVASSPTAIVLAIIGFQLAVNAMLAPLMAIMADEIPDAQKGVTGGLLALASPLASAVSAVLVGVALTEAGRLGFVVLAVAVLITPLIFIPSRPVVATVGPVAEPVLRRDLLTAWTARLLVQIAGTALFFYLLYYFESIVASWDGLPARVGHVMTIAYIVPLPIAVLLGRLSDRTDRRKPFLFGAAVFAALGLFGMALAEQWNTAVLAFGLYAVGSSVFLALHSAFAMQLLPDPQHRGRDLGLLNLTNTLPALLGPLLTWLLATPQDFDAVMLVLGGLTLCGGVVILAVQGRR